MRVRTVALATAACLTMMPLLGGAALAQDGEVGLGPRPYYLVNLLEDGELKSALEACEGPFARHPFSIGHRGAALQFPEHTRESYVAAARMGAGIVECDVTFTKDRELVCRHAQCDLHTTTNILATDLASKCSEPFTPAEGDTPASAKCCTSDLTLAEFKSLQGKMDAADDTATTVEAYMSATADYRTDLYSPGTLMTHAESIALFQQLGVGFTPELKTPEVEMPFEGDYTQEMFAQAMLDDYKAAGVDPAQVWPQSFNEEDVYFWLENEPEFGAQAIYLDDRYDLEDFDPTDPATWSPSMAELAENGVEIIAPPMWMLVAVENGEIVPSTYAEEAKAAGLDIITWTLERSGPLNVENGGWYYQSIAEVIDDDGDMLVLLDVLAQDVGVLGVFSDWPATTTYYANCMDLQ